MSARYTDQRQKYVMAVSVGHHPPSYLPKYNTTKKSRYDAEPYQLR